jgi:hypothetical protein
MSRAFPPIALALGLSATALLAGCASPGDPTPRHPVVPAPVADLAAHQSGSEIVLTFTLPARSTDREALSEPPSVEIFRAELAPGATPNKKTPWNLAYAIPSERVESYARDSHLTFHDPQAPASLVRVEGASLAYMVRTRAAKARASDNSNILMLRVFPPPAPPGEVRAAVTESAIALSWTGATPPSGSSQQGYRVYRTQVESAQENIPQDLSQAKLKSPQELIVSINTPEYRDLHFEFGETYLYTVRSVAAFGADLVESADSAPAMVTARDVFPPASPLALEAAVIPATGQAPAYVELSWGISPEPDLAGYRIYRSDLEVAPGERLNTELLPSPAFRDISVTSGKQYFYRVSAVDRAGNESPASSAVSAEVP